MHLNNLGHPSFSKPTHFPKGILLLAEAVLKFSRAEMQTKEALKSC